MIWTPDNPLADPVCRKCGGFDRQWLRVHRHHAGMSFHRACCCICKGKPESLSVLVSGVDDTYCECVEIGNGTRVDHSGPAFDGEYLVSPYAEVNAGTIFAPDIQCEYRACFELSSAITQTQHGSGDGSCAESTGSKEVTHLRVTVRLDSSENVTRIWLVAFANLTDCLAPAATTLTSLDLFRNDSTVSLASGSSVGNSLVCGTGFNTSSVACDGGTCTATEDEGV